MGSLGFSLGLRGLGCRGVGIRGLIRLWDFGFWSLGRLVFGRRADSVLGGFGYPRASKNPLIKEYTLNHIRDPIII